MRRLLIFILISILVGAPIMVFASDGESIVTDSYKTVSVQLRETLISNTAFYIFGIVLTLISSLFGYLAIKFPKLAGYFYELQSITQKEISRTEGKRKGFSKDLTAKQAIELKNETTERIINTKPAQELRRGVANLFGIFGGRSKELGKNLFDNLIPGLIDKQVSKIKSNI